MKKKSKKQKHEQRKTLLQRAKELFALGRKGRAQKLFQRAFKMTEISSFEVEDEKKQEMCALVEVKITPTKKEEFIQLI